MSNVCSVSRRFAVPTLLLLAAAAAAQAAVSGLPTTTAVASNNNPSFTGDPVTFTATVTSSGSPVTVGTVTFKEGVTVLAANIALNGSGQSAFLTSALTEGTHSITAEYNGDPAYLPSSGSVTQVVNDHTTVNGTEFCNPGGLTINAAGGGTPYPASIFVTGLAGTIAKVTLKLDGLTHANPDDIDVDLAGPTGAALVPMSDAGGSYAVSGITLTLDDAGSALPDSATLATGTFKPGSFSPSDSFPSPAPGGASLAAPEGSATFLSVFGGTDPNGTWKVFVANDGTANAGSIATGVCLAFTMNPPDLSISKTHSGGFAQAQTGVQYTITVTNNGPGSTAGTVTVTDTLPTGLTATSFGGTSWTCLPLPALSCSRSDPLPSGNSYEPIILVADVAADAPPTIVNSAAVTGGGAVASANDQATDAADVSSSPLPALDLPGIAALVALLAVAGAAAVRRSGSA